MFHERTYVRRGDWLGGVGARLCDGIGRDREVVKAGKICFCTAKKRGLKAATAPKRRARSHWLVGLFMLCVAPFPLSQSLTGRGRVSPSLCVVTLTRSLTHSLSRSSYCCIAVPPHPPLPSPFPAAPSPIPPTHTHTWTHPSHHRMRFNTRPWSRSSKSPRRTRTVMARTMAGWV